MCRSNIHEEALGGERDRGGPSETGRLTQEEARMTVAQTLEVVHGLMNTVKVVLDGTQAFLCHFSVNLTILRVDGKASTENIRQALSTSWLEP